MDTDAVHAYSGVPLSRKKNKAMPLAAAQTGLEFVTLSVASQTAKDKHHTTALTCEILNDTNELIHKRETESQTWETSLCVPKRTQGSGEEEEIN